MSRPITEKFMIEITRHNGHNRLQTELWLPHDVEHVFAFFAEAANLEAITPPWLQFRILTPRPIQMSPGTLIDYRLRLHGIPIRWRTEISVWEPPRRFVDRQVRGPYRLWEHTHTFTEVRGGTLVRDDVHYAAPGGWFVEQILVRPDLRRIFEYRSRSLRDRFLKSPQELRNSLPTEGNH